jgi:hypothetical protein
MWTEGDAWLVLQIGRPQAYHACRVGAGVAGRVAASGSALSSIDTCGEHPERARPEVGGPDVRHGSYVCSQRVTSR